MPGLQIVAEKGELMGAFIAEDAGRNQIWRIMHTLVTTFDVLGPIFCSKYQGLRPTAPLCDTPSTVNDHPKLPCCPLSLDLLK